MDHTVSCLDCGKLFEAKRVGAKYCNSTCRSRASRSPLNRKVVTTERTPGSPRPEVSTALAPLAVLPRSEPSAPVAQEPLSLESAFRNAHTELALTPYSPLNRTLATAESAPGAVEQSADRLADLEIAMAKLGPLLARLEALEQARTQAETRLTSVERRPTGLDPALHQRLQTLEQSTAAVPRLTQQLSGMQAHLDTLASELRAMRNSDPSSLQRTVQTQVRQALMPLEQQLNAIQGRLERREDSPHPRLPQLEQKVHTLALQLASNDPEQVEIRLRRIEQQLQNGQAQRTQAMERLHSELTQVFNSFVSRLSEVESTCAHIHAQQEQMLTTLISHGIYSVQEDTESSNDTEDDDENDRFSRYSWP